MREFYHVVYGLCSLCFLTETLLATQCTDAEACLSLCQQKVEVCEAKDKEAKRACAQKADAILPCPTSERLVPGTLCTLSPDTVSPTQYSVGLLAAECKADKIESKAREQKLKRYLLKRVVPAVVGPNDKFFITDRHHLSIGLLKAEIAEDRKKLYMCVVEDRRDDSVPDFWNYMVANNNAWLYNDKGKEISGTDLPSSLEDLADDPYRTLSRWVRESCGYIKCGEECDTTEDGKVEMCQGNPTPPYFLEFKWANYLRYEVPIEGIYELEGPEQAVQLEKHLQDAMAAASDEAASTWDLPGRNHGRVPTKLIRVEKGCED